MSMQRVFLAAAVILVTSGCSITRPVTDDYAQYLGNNKGAASLPAAHVAQQYYLPPATQQHHYEFRSALAGYANVWSVDFGKVLDATMQSADVAAALGKLNKAASDQPGNGNTLVFELQNYTFEDHGAHVEMMISVRNAQGNAFSKSYKADGRTQGAKMFFGGAFGMKNAVQQSTKIAIDTILGQFIRDVNASPGAVAKQ